MKNGFDGLVLVIGLLFVAFTATLDKEASVKVLVVAIAVFLIYKMFFAKKIEEEHLKYHGKNSVPVKKVTKAKKKSAKRRK